MRKKNIMKKILKKSLPLIILVGLFASCNEISNKVDKKLDELSNKAEHLDSLVNKEINKVKGLDSFINKSASKIDSLTNKKMESLEKNIIE